MKNKTLKNIFGIAAWFVVPMLGYLAFDQAGFSIGIFLVGVSSFAVNLASNRNKARHSNDASKTNKLSL
jgi:hypothetical protein